MNAVLKCFHVFLEMTGLRKQFSSLSEESFQTEATRDKRSTKYRSCSSMKALEQNIFAVGI